MPDYETLITDGSIKLCKIDGELVYLIDGLAFENDKLLTVTYGLFQSDLRKYADRGQSYAIAQFYSLVGNGLILTRHIFSGLNRPLCDDDCMDADQGKIVHSRKPIWDYKWKDIDKQKKISAPSGKVFVTIISKNIKHTARFTMVYGWVDWWNWVDEDEGLAEAPINWVDRYGNRLYSRP
jgi:hypothetical protein